ncbi:gp53-like domain-containing protein, partial [Enterobacter sp. PTB]|uniref:gp53-like domain-containing protein n=1 Tax=Enterobacter sp. PTB TaxID=3143437 RepID=UPI003DA7E72D
VSFDGTANINLPGVNTAGSQSTSGNAATATKLATARAIAGVNFDGSDAISIPAGNVGAYTKAEVDSKVNAKAAPNSASKAANGWWKCASTGIIFQWGKNASTAVGNTTVTFPIAFPGACVSVQNTWIRNSGEPGTKPWGFVTSFNTTTASVTGDTMGSYWFAIGY